MRRRKKLSQTNVLKLKQGYVQNSIENHITHKYTHAHAHITYTHGTHHNFNEVTNFFSVVFRFFLAQSTQHICDASHTFSEQHQYKSPRYRMSLWLSLFFLSFVSFWLLLRLMMLFGFSSSRPTESIGSVCFIFDVVPKMQCVKPTHACAFRSQNAFQFKFLRMRFLCFPICLYIGVG